MKNIILAILSASFLSSCGGAADVGSNNDPQFLQNALKENYEQIIEIPLEITTGYTSSVFKEDKQYHIYLKNYIETERKPNEPGKDVFGPEFKDIGYSFRQALGLAFFNTYEQPTLTGSEVKNFKYNMKVYIGTQEQISRVCHETKDGAGKACAFIDELPQCYIFIVRNPHYDQNRNEEAVYGHELWHCVAGYYHNN